MPEEIQIEMDSSGASALAEINLDPGPEAIIRQAMALAVQDATANLRETYTIANAAMGVAQEMLLSGANIDGARASLEASRKSIDDAIMRFEKVSSAASAMLHTLSD